MITPTDFLEYTTYNRLFHYLTITPAIATWLEQCGKEDCVVEHADNGEIICWYPIEEWHREQKRRAAIQIKHDIVIKPVAKTKDELMKELFEAMNQQNMKRVQELSNLIAKL